MELTTKKPISLIILQGNLFSGKTTFAKQFKTAFSYSTIYSIDDYRILYGNDELDGEGMAWDMMFTDVLDCNNPIAVCDTTGISKNMSRLWAINKLSIKIYCPVSECLRRYSTEPNSRNHIPYPYKDKINNTIKRMSVLLMDIKSDVILSSLDTPDKMIENLINEEEFQTFISHVQKSIANT